MFCSKCGTQLPDGSAFCGNCGNPVAAPAAPVAPVAPVAEVPAQPVYEAPVAPAPVAVETPAAPVAPAPVYQQPVAPAPVYQQPVAPAPKKKGNATLIAIIAVVAVLAIVAGVLFATGAFDSDSGDKDDDKDTGSSTTTTVDGNGTTTTVGGGIPGIGDNSTTTTAPTQTPVTQTPVTQAPTQAPTQIPDAVAYTKGSYSNGVYTNKWAELQYAPEGEWENGSAAEYAAFQNATTECGLCIKRVNREEGIYDANVSIAFENVKNANVTVADYVKILRNTLREQYADQGYTIDMTDSLEIGLANHYWTEFSMELNGGALHQRMMITEQDGYIICMTITAMDGSELNRLARSLTFYM